MGGKKQPGPKDFCDGCSAYLHCCLNCRFYDEGAPNKCYIPNTEWVADKAGANFCDEFEFADDTTEGRGNQKESDARDAFHHLFGDNPDEAGTGPADFNKLFGD